MANCSLLGFLGFVRGLLKFGIGKEACEKAGYSIKPLQPYMGLAEDNLLPQGKFNPVIYLKGKKIGDLFEWSVVKVIYHTARSLYTLNARHSSPSDNYEPVVIQQITPSSRSNFFKLGTIVNLLASGATSFPVLVLLGKSWQSLIASFGLFGSLSTGSLLWIWIFSQGQTPRQKLLGVFGGNTLVDSDDYLDFAFWRHESQYGVFKCRAVSGSIRRWISAASISAALLTSVAYIFKYISLQGMTTKQVGIWVG
jgi:hypothetical protein